MGCRNEEGSSSLNAIVPVHDFAQHKIISMKKKTCVPSPKSYLVSSDIEVEQNMSWIPYYLEHNVYEVMLFELKVYIS